ncbi:MAG: ATP-dependent 6-phosphofructokinase [Eubacteriales bacterium]|jgi:6-phosphofructokinase 1|nr:ATP-dependent 6-phosphofructokinase [Eubacteriales bacterium]MDD3571648.1 ATP-dependent 6-phosphofructokinase [Eubacteriales bacterium]MDD4134633.1 ATP-dependent 6-phosphofructokinase [Eubacteriales bacterium]NLO12683.1 ATP-dependent 6-phosphofructokinase [Clostridiales bacterium]
MQKKIAVLTSGGDSPGMNAAVMEVARAAAKANMRLVGIKHGFNGLIGKFPKASDNYTILSLDTVLDIADLPGTYLRTARSPEFFELEYQQKAADFLKGIGVCGLVVIGGDGSYQGAQKLVELGVPCVGIPGTIDNDLEYSETSLGFDTAVNVCMEAVRSIRATSRSHDRPAVVEVMGRNCGDIAMSTAMSTASEVVVVPEVEGWEVDQVAARLSSLIARGNTRATIVVAEGAWKVMKPFDVYEFLKPYKQVFPGEPMNAYRFASILKRMCGAEVRANVIGYTQRGHEPTAQDAVFAFEAGNMAVELLKNGVGNQAIGVRLGRTFHMDLVKALDVKPVFNQHQFDLINSL